MCQPSWMAVICPILSVRDGARAVSFYLSVFGAIERLRLEDGGNVFAELEIDGAVLFVSDESPEHGNVAPDGQSSAVRLVLEVADPDVVYEKAIREGATGVVPIEDTHGWRVGRLVDPFGHHWEIGKRKGRNTA